MPVNEQESKQFAKWGVPEPQSFDHLTEEEIRKNMVTLKPTSYRQEGNKLIGITEFGELVNFLPTDLIFTGVDKDGLPTFRKVDIQT